MARAATPSATKLTKVVAVETITYGVPVLGDDGKPEMVDRVHNGVKRRVPLTENVTVQAGSTFTVDREFLAELRAKKLVRAPDPVLDDEDEGDDV